MGGRLVVFTDGVREEERKKVLLPAFLMPKYPGSSLTATAVLITVFQCLCSSLNPLDTLIESQKSQNSLGWKGA